MEHDLGEKFEGKKLSIKLFSLPYEGVSAAIEPNLFFDNKKKPLEPNYPSLLTLNPF